MIIFLVANALCFAGSLVTVHSEFEVCCFSHAYLPMGLSLSGARVVDFRQYMWSHISELFIPELIEHPQDASNRTADRSVKAS